ncbi:NAD(P)H-binding protein [Peribacillus frigoritolerans]|uniref:NAD(P)H-binding protein n=1 Tax=Peribacillus frigoritolerans TaxID=450367 RepID=UPI003518E26A
MWNNLKYLNPDEAIEKMRPYAVAKHVLDFYLKQSSLDYTIIHPGPLLNDKPTGKIDVSVELKGDLNEYLITRQDVESLLILQKVIL